MSKNRVDPRDVFVVFATPDARSVPAMNIAEAAAVVEGVFVAFNRHGQSRRAKARNGNVTTRIADAVRETRGVLSGGAAALGNITCPARDKRGHTVSSFDPTTFAQNVAGRLRAFRALIRVGQHHVSLDVSALEVWQATQSLVWSEYIESDPNRLLEVRRQSLFYRKTTSP